MDSFRSEDHPGEFEDISGNKAKIEEVFLISSVVHPLLAVGKLPKKGWGFRNGTANRTFLVEGTTHIPVNYNNNSRTAKAFVYQENPNPCTCVTTSTILLQKAV